MQDLTGKLGYSRKKPNIGDWRHGIFHFFTLPLEIPDKTKLHPWKSHKIVLDPLEISRLKSKTPGKFTLFYLGYPIPHPQPPPLFVFFQEQPISELGLLLITKAGSTPGRCCCCMMVCKILCCSEFLKTGKNLTFRYFIIYLRIVMWL